MPRRCMMVITQTAIAVEITLIGISLLSAVDRDVIPTYHNAAGRFPSRKSQFPSLEKSCHPRTLNSISILIYFNLYKYIFRYVFNNLAIKRNLQLKNIYYYKYIIIKNIKY